MNVKHALKSTIAPKITPANYKSGCIFDKMTKGMAGYASDLPDNMRSVYETIRIDLIYASSFALC